MTQDQVIRLAVGLATPVVLTPLAIIGLRKLFTLFLAEGIDLFSTLPLAGEDAKTLGSLMAKLNVIVLLFAWLILFTCQCFEQSMWIVAGIGIAGLAGALLITVMVIRTNLEMRGRTLWAVSLLTFTGGNLPIIIATGVLLALLPRILELTQG